MVNANLLGGWATPLKNMSSSVGMIIPNIWENKNVPNHQPVVERERASKYSSIICIMYGISSMHT